MSGRSLLAVKIALGALGLGLLGGILFSDTAFGINAALWTLALFVSGAIVFRSGQIEVSKKSLALLLPALFFTIGFALQDSPGLRVANAICLVVSMSFAATHLQNKSVDKMTLLDSTIGWMVSMVTLIVDTFALWIEDIQWKLIGSKINTRNITPYLRGIAFAVPIVIVFGLLMASADAVFGKFAATAFKLDLSSAFVHGLRVVAFMSLAVAVMRRAFLGQALNIRPVAKEDDVERTTSTESIIVVAALDVLFAIFVAIQFRYLYGGHDMVSATTGLTYSEYARRGFFELVAITALALPVLLACTHSVANASSTVRKSFKVFAVGLVFMLGVVMASAIQRMSLYVASLGMSELRLYTSAFMGWMALVYVAYFLTYLRDRPAKFSYLSLAAGLAVCIGLNALRPGAFIADYNVAASRFGAHLDVDYLTTLGTDSVPALMRAWPDLNKNDKTVAANWLQEVDSRWSPDWRSWNWSRNEAHRLIGQKKTEIAALAANGAAIAYSD